MIHKPTYKTLELMESCLSAFLPLDAVRAILVYEGTFRLFGDTFYRKLTARDKRLAIVQNKRTAPVEMYQDWEYTAYYFYVPYAPTLRKKHLYRYVRYFNENYANRYTDDDGGDRNVEIVMFI